MDGQTPIRTLVTCAFTYGFSLEFLLHLIEENNYEFNLLRNKNIIIGKYLLLLFYYEDIILDTNYRTNLIKLAKNDDSDAQYILATSYMDGIKMPKDEEEAYSSVNDVKIDKDKKELTF